ncbi:MAG: hypothetical protein AAF961_11475, partial [Planctomycetota bacterium]
GIRRATIDDEPVDVRLLEVDDLLIGPDDTIFFEAEAEIRRLDQLGDFKNYVWSMAWNEEQGKYEDPQALLAEGQFALNLADPISFGNRFTLKDADGEGNLLLTARLDDDHSSVGSGNDDLLMLLDAEGFQTVVARENDPIPQRDGSFYGVPVAGRGNSLSEDGDIVFQSSAPFNDPLPARLPAVFLASAKTESTLDFVWSGGCGTRNWHAECSESNWDDAALGGGTPAEIWPGDGNGTETATINAADVILSDQSVHLKALHATGSLVVMTPLTLQEASEISNLQLESTLTLDAEPGSDGKLTLHGQNTWLSGEITNGSPLTLLNSAQVVVAPNARLTIEAGGVGQGVALSNQIDLVSHGTIRLRDVELVVGDQEDSPSRVVIDDGGTGILTGNAEVTGFGAVVVRGSGALKNAVPAPGTGPAGDAEIRADVHLEDGGTLDVGAGKLTVFGNGSHAGKYDIAKAGTLKFVDSQIDVAASQHAEGGGLLVFSGGKLNVAGPDGKATFNLGEGAGTGVVIGDLSPDAAGGKTEVQLGGVLRNEGRATLQHVHIAKSPGSGRFENVGTLRIRQPASSGTPGDPPNVPLITL